MYQAYLCGVIDKRIYLKRPLIDATRTTIANTKIAISIMVIPIKNSGRLKEGGNISVHASPVNTAPKIIDPKANSIVRAILITLD